MNKKLKLHFITVILVLTFLPDMSSGTQLTLVEESATKRVLVPQADIGDSWRQEINYNDSNWQLCEGAPGGVGYEKSSGYEELISLDVGSEMHSDGGNPNTSCYIRIPFDLNSADLDSIIFLLLKIRYDDGFKAYLNGRKFAIANAPVEDYWNSTATADHEVNGATVINISRYIEYLVPGQNLLAIHGMNTSTASSDFLITAELAASDSPYGDFVSSNLPIIHINSNGQTIPDEPKITGSMKVINNGPGELNHPEDPPTDYDGYIGVEIRGAYSSTFPQKPYGIETRDAMGENLNVSLLGMPVENDWALITNYNEKSHVRNLLAFKLFREMGHYSPRVELCEVLVNDVYRGIYVFSETIKRDKNRVDIATLRPDENTGDDLTGGYIIKIDYHNPNDSWLSNYTPPGHPDQKVYFVYHYPEWDDISEQQKSYIQSFIDSLQEALFGNNFDDPTLGYRKYLDVPSFIDYLILSEVSRNVDGIKKSRYFYKNKDSNDSLLYAGPIWDFDWAWKDIGSGSWVATDGSGWAWKTNDGNPDINPPGWYIRLFQDGYFTNQFIDRYQELRSNVIDLNRIYAYIDSVVIHVGDAQERHFELWPIDQGYIAPEPGPPSQTYEEEIIKLKNWIELRFSWLDENVPKLRDNIITSVKSPEAQTTDAVTYRLYPNPISDVLQINSSKPISVIKVYNVLGQQVYSSGPMLSTSERIQLSGLSPGPYFIQLIDNNQKFQIRKIMISR